MGKVLFLNDTSNELHIGSCAISEYIKSILYDSDIVPVQYDGGVYQFDTAESYSLVVVNAEGTLSRVSERSQRLIDAILAVSDVKNIVLLSCDLCPENAKKLEGVGFYFVHYRRHHGADEVLDAKQSVTMPDIFYHVCMVELEGENIFSIRKKGRIYGDSHCYEDFDRLIDISKSDNELSAQSMMVFCKYSFLHVDFFKSIFWFLSRDRYAMWRKRYSVFGFKRWLLKLASANYLVTGRFHHAVAAMAVGTPVYYVESKTKKIRCLSEFFGEGVSEFSGALVTGGESFVPDPQAYDYSIIKLKIRECIS